MKTTTLAASALAAVVSAAVASVAFAGPAPVPTQFKFEKCAGVAKAGQNDCQTAMSSCAGTSKRDGQTDAWVYLPEGSCAKIVGGKKM